MNLLSLHNSPEHIAAQTAAIGQTILRESGNLKQPNFECIGVEDLARLFELYDRAFFGGRLAEAAKEQTGRPPVFRLSPTMTRAGGKTSLYRQRAPGGQVQTYYEIAVASRMLFMTFGQVERPVVVCGLTCANRLEALQRILEHEIIHLAEWIACGKTGCGGRRFKDLAANIFGHAGTKHALVTPVEHAADRHGIRLGSLVSFDFEGRRLVGRVNRAHSRATVLVEDARGLPYTDGKRYQKYYIPFGMLSPAAGCGEGV
ncbi:MAG: SprT-like family protein [Planctomycetota bacterium]|nr:SprT-like family protein [Planctomycetota bacterium]